jgi:putative heme-binding domain-containing protein
MYRLHIEHPEYIPDDVDQWTNFREGESMGRIYRVVPRRPAPTPREIPQSDLTSDTRMGWLLALESPNGWIRDQAHARLMHLIEPDGKLRSGAAGLYHRTDSLKARLHLMWIFLEWGMLDMEWMQVLMREGDPRLRSQAWTVFSRWVGNNPQLTLDPQAVGSWVENCRAGDLFHAALALGGIEDRRFVSSPKRLWTTLVRKAVSQEDWMLEEALLAGAAHSRWIVLMEAIMSAVADDPDLSPQLKWAEWIRTGAREHKIAVDDFAAVLTGLLRPSDPDRENPIDDIQRVNAVLASLNGLDPSHEKRRAAVNAPGFRDLVHYWAVTSPDIAGDTSIAAAERSDAIRLSGLVHAFGTTSPELRQKIRSLIDLNQPEAIQSAAMEALLGMDRAVAVAGLSPRWQELVPELRRRLLEAALESPAAADAFLEAVESGVVPSSQISVFDRQAFMESGWAAVAARARGLWQSRPASVDISRQWTAGAGDPSRGRKLFRQQCALCHRLRGEGVAVGPDLDAYGTKPWDYFVEALARPSAAVDPAYQQVVVSSQNGNSWSGILLDRSPERITLGLAGGQSVTISGEELEDIDFMSTSLMPEGLAEALGEQGTRDLWEYLRRPF